MSAAEPTDPQDAEVAKMYINDFPTFERTAKFWTDSYAKPRSETLDEATVQSLCDMGFPKETVVQKLTEHKGDQNAALEALLSGI